MQPSLFVIEPLAHDRFLQNMKWLEGRSHRPGGNFLLRLELREKPNLHLARARLRNSRPGGSHLVDLLVEERGKKEKLRLPEPESFVPLRDASFAQQDHLLSAP